MSDFLDRISKLSPKRLALLALEQHEQLQATGARNREPIAVVGIGCRFPGGADDPRAFWQLLAQGRDAIRDVPPERWPIDAYFDPDPDAPARMSVRTGGFLDRIDGFDAAFFGISPREALTMDPQQRLLLEVSWEALEHAGIAPERLAGSATGVFVGICNSDHFQRVLYRGVETIDAYLASGNAHSVAAGRISYCLGLRGPSLAIDTACSSSLVALHVACRSLREGESSVALAAGVNMMCSPETTIALTKAHMLAPDGRCKTFDARADGFARGEGCGVLVLKRLTDATAAGDRVLAVIRGTALNQDGRSGGLTVPNGPAQEDVIRAALTDAGVDPGEVDYVEAHGTGTSLGDPIEVRALAGALGAGRAPDAPLKIGSVKTNIGHLESAAGIAGVIKVVLSLQHERIPPHLHFTQPSPHIPWSQYPIAVTAHGSAWPRGDRRRLAGVSSFGFSGTNAHVIIEEAPLRVPAEQSPPRTVHCLALSARSESALRQLAGRHRVAMLEPSAPSLGDVAHTLGAGRSHFAERAALVVAQPADAIDALGALADGAPHPEVRRGRTSPGRRLEVVFMFTGQGAQYPGMARGLYAQSPVFREVIDRCDDQLGADPHGRRLRDVLWSDEGDSPAIHDTVWTQPALFAVECALAQLWRSWGVEPAAVIGHSVGEYAAACVAGVLSLEDGLRLIAERGRLMGSLPPGGAMAALFAPLDDVTDAIRPFADRVSIAAVNAADSVVISGDAGAVDELLARFAARSVQGHRLFVSFAAHSPLVAPALESMRACAARVAMHPPRIPVAWNVTGGGALESGAAPDAQYWCRHLREPVRFADGLEFLHREGYRCFLEVGPHPTLVALAQRTLSGSDVVFAHALRRKHDDWSESMKAVAELYTAGADIDWSALDGPTGTQSAELPTYPFERQSFWIATEAASLRVRRPAPGAAVPLAGVRIPGAARVFETTLTPSSPAYLDGHRVQGAALLAGPVLLALAHAAAEAELGPRARAIEGFAVREPLIVKDVGTRVQTHLGEPHLDPGAASGWPGFTIHSGGSGEDDTWRLHACGRFAAAEPEALGPAEPGAIAAISARLGQAVDCEAHYGKLSAFGIELQGPFRGMREAWCGDLEALVRIDVHEPGGGAGVGLHPATVDCALQSVGLALPESNNPASLYLLSAIDRIDLTPSDERTLWCHVVVAAPSHADPPEWQADIAVMSVDGRLVGRLTGVRLRRAHPQALRIASSAARADRAANTDSVSESTLRYAVEWQDAPVMQPAASALSAPADLGRDAVARFEELAQVHGLDVYDRLLPELDRVCNAHVVAALADLGFDDRVGRVFEAGDERLRLGIVARHEGLFVRMLGMLAQDGLLRVASKPDTTSRSGRFEVLQRFPRRDPLSDYPRLLHEFDPVCGELRTLRRCAGELAPVLSGTMNPLQLLFPGGSLTEARELYVESPFARTYNGALADTLAMAIAGLSKDGRLRVLEIGAGTGGTTGYVLPVLQAGSVEYTFTDLSPLFLEQAARRFEGHPCLRTALLDIERDPLEQGFEPSGFDVVIAANVLHATADVGAALRHVRRLMAPGGLLFLLEGVQPARWVDLTFGMTEGWWRFSDHQRRPDHPLLSASAWADALSAQGFDDVVTVPRAAPAIESRSQQALIVARAARLPRSWRVVGDVHGVGAALARRLAARGDQVSLGSVDDDPGQMAAGTQLVYLGALELDDCNSRDPATVDACIRLSAERPLGWLSSAAGGGNGTRAWLVSRAAQAAHGPPSAGGRWQAPLWGLGRVFALEHPACWGGLVDLSAQGAADEQADCLMASLGAEDGEDQTAWRDGRRLAARLTSASVTQSVLGPLRPDATYLVTGGFGGLGLIVGRWLAEMGARHVALMGRHPLLDSDGVRAIEARGAQVHALAADVTDDQAVHTSLRDLAGRAPPVRGVVHAAAALNAAPIRELSIARVREMMGPKIRGTIALERALRDAPLDFVTLFSSSTALLGASGLAHYAAANAFLDATASMQNRPGRRVLSVNWGTWAAMRAASAADRRSFVEAGLQPMPADDALAELGSLLSEAEPAQAMVAKVDWRVLKPLHEARRARPFLARLKAAEPSRDSNMSDRGAAQSAVTSDLVARLGRAPGSMRRDMLVDFVRGEVAGVLALKGDQDVPLEVGLFDQGMDSLMSVELKRRLERGAGRPLPSTLTFNYPNVAAIAGFLERELAPAFPDGGSASVLGTLSASAPPIDGDGVSPAGALDSLSEDELEARLLAKLEQIR